MPKWRRLTCFIVLSALSFYCAMLVGTNSFINQIESLMFGVVPKFETEGKLIDRYNVKFLSGLTKEETSFKITRFFVLHNFFDGYIWAKIHFHLIEDIDEQFFNEIGIKGITPIPPTDIYVRWKIHRVNGVWELIDEKQYQYPKKKDGDIICID